MHRDVQPAARGAETGRDSVKAGLRLLAGFAPALEAAYQDSRREATRFLRLAGLGFALLAYPSFLLLDALWGRQLQHGWVYALCFGLAWPATLLAWLAAWRQWRGVFEERRLLILAVVANLVGLCAASGFGLVRGVEIPFEAFLQLIVYIYVLGGLGFGTAALLGALMLTGYALSAALAGMAGELLARKLYFLISLWIMSGVGASLMEIHARRAWLGRRRLREAQGLLQGFLDNAPALSWIKDADGRYRFASQSFRDFLGAPGADLIGHTDADLFPAEFARRCREAEQAVLETGAASEMVGPSPSPSGSRGSDREWMLVRFAIDDTEGQRLIGGVATEVTERRRLERALIESERRVRGMVDNSPALVWMKDERFGYTYLSQNYQRLLGVEGRDWVGMSDADFWPAELVEQFHRSDVEVLASGRSLEAVESTPGPDGSTTWWRVLKFPHTDARGVRFVGGIAFDISAQHHAEAALRLSSLTDELTGLYNRRGFVSLAEQQRQRAPREAVDGALLFVDVNGLKGINDGHGHGEGDRAIVAIGEAIRIAVRDSDIAARIGGDEFAVFAPRCPDPDQLRERIQRQIADADASEPRPYRLAASIGCVRVRYGGTEPFEDLLAAADAEMYAVKKRR